MAIIGAGPKAIAIAAKARAMHLVRQETGKDSPEIVILERDCVAANWKGQCGYTDGDQILCTLPEKDVGFPYTSEAVVNKEMSRLSWQSFLIEEGSFSSWIDRGRPHPRHARFAEYLNWVSDKIEAQIQYGDVSQIKRAGNLWEILFRDPKGKPRKLLANGLVVTGHGQPRNLPGLQNDGRILDGQSFWHRLKDFQGLNEEKIAVIGSGETAAAIVVALVRKVSPLTAIIVVNRQGTIFSRGESYDENKLFSLPGKWRHIGVAQRREFLQRTDRGVFSVNAKRILNTAENVTHYALDVVRIKRSGAGKLLLVGRTNRQVTLECDWVINATSFDQRWFRGLFSGEARRVLMRSTSAELENLVDRDLSLRGLRPKLHAPMLAALQQGPGFPNLTCLGLLADRILEPYLTSYVQPGSNHGIQDVDPGLSVGRQPEGEFRRLDPHGAPRPRGAKSTRKNRRSTKQAEASKHRFRSPRRLGYQRPAATGI
ncbi:MAG: SidA/IucD/PvdA family monooxygenase [Terriglobales bacterium]